MYSIEPIGFVQAERHEAEDDFWGESQACITLTDSFTDEALLGLSDFSHAEILFLFHAADPAKVVRGARRPRGNPNWPLVGIFAQRAKNRPNRIGTTLCPIVRCEGRQLFVAELDAIDGTPIVDIKPVMAEFLPRGIMRQPRWSHELMGQYWMAGPRR